MITYDIHKVKFLIGQFFLEENDGDYDSTYDEIDKMNFTDLTVKEKEIEIELVRVGLFIGRKGEKIERFAKFMKDNLDEEIKIKLKENILISGIYPIYYDDRIQMFL